MTSGTGTPNQGPCSASPDLTGAHLLGALTPKARLVIEGHAACYALGALNPGETTAYASHLQRCAYCRSIVAYFGAVVDSLPAAVRPVPASPAVKARLLAAVRNDLLTR